MKLNLSKRIGGIVGAIVLIISLTIGLISINYSSYDLVKQQKESLQLLANEGANRIKEIINTQLQVLSEIGSTTTMVSMSWDLQKQALASTVTRLGFLDIAVVSPDGTAQYAISGETSQLGDKEFIKSALDGKTDVSDIIIDKKTKKPVIMYAVPIKAYGAVAGVLVGIKDGTELNDITDQMGLGKRGYAFIVGLDSTLLSHPNRDLVLKQTKVYKEIEANGPLKAFGNALKKLGIQKTGIIKYKYNKENRLTAMTPVPNTRWTLGVGNYENDVLETMYNLIKFLLVIIGIVLILGIIAGVLVGRFISKPISRILDSVERMSRYDFTENLSKQDTKILKRSDEIGTIAKAVVKMKENITALVQAVAENSQQVAVSSEELTSIAGQSAISANEISRTIEEISRGAYDQAKETESGSIIIQTLSQLIAKEQSYIYELNESLNQVNTLKDMGLVAIKDLNQKNSESSQAAIDIYNVIMETSKSAEKIESASNMIKNIADQTNLLSLNAAIEAARAGDAGRGFAVVSEEIRELAEQSKRFTDEITLIIRDLSNKTEISVKAIESVSVIMNFQTESVNNTSDKFEGINNAIEKIKLIIDNLNDAGNEMQSMKQEIVTVMENLSAISEENAAGTQESSASVQVQTSSTQEVANASEALAQLAEYLQSEVQKFKY